MDKKINDVDIRTTTIETDLNYIKKDTDEIKTDINNIDNNLDNNLDKIDKNLVNINISLAEIKTINNKESIDNKKKWNRVFMFVSIVAACLVAFLVYKYY